MRGMTDLVLAIWTKASSRRKRLLSIVAVFIVAVVITSVGSFMPISPQDAEKISSDLNQTSTTLQNQGALTQYIFGNNLLICLIMFIPVLGPVLGLFIMFNTGTVVGAIAVSSGLSPLLSLIAIFITPVGWLEFAAYSTAMAESVWLFRRFFQRRGLRELRNMTIFVTICALLLAVGAIVETALINVGL
jgi:uncharacterized membrane protein SpoIIM required for sporulation